MWTFCHLQVLVGVLTQREVRETRQLVVRRGDGETRAESNLSCSRIEAQHLSGACNASTSSTTSTLSSGTRGALDSVLHAGQGRQWRDTPVARAAYPPLGRRHDNRPRLCACCCCR